jgi:hypothetical protein
MFDIQFASRYQFVIMPVVLVTPVDVTRDLLMHVFRQELWLGKLLNYQIVPDTNPDKIYYHGCQIIFHSVQIVRNLLIELVISSYTSLNLWCFPAMISYKLQYGWKILDTLP